MPRVRTASLLALLAVGVLCVAWLVWGLGRDVEVGDPLVDVASRTDVVVQPPTPTPTPVAEPPREVFDGALVDHLARWARSPQQRARWMDAIRLGGEGLSRFERRLWIGELLEHVAQDVGTGRIAPKHAHELFAALYHLGALHLERWGSGVPVIAARRYGSRKALVDALREITRPARSRHAFRLHGHEGDPLATGRDLRLRVWTPRGQGLDPVRVEETRSLLERLDVVAGVDAPASVDLLATASRGDDVFPTLAKLPFRFIGVYLPRDRFAVVGTRHPAEQLRRLIQHEVIHAWQFAALPTWETTFTIEGLATYGSHLRSSDEGLAVPAERLQDDLAWLRRTVARLASRGVTVGDAHLGALIRAKPWEFYSLGWFGYVIAEACFAYLGPRAIGEALRSGGEEDLLVQLRAIRWSKLMGWADEHAKGGDPDAAWVVTESPLPGQDRPLEPGADEGLLVDLGLERRSGQRDIAEEPPPRRPARPRPARPPSPARSGPAKEPEHQGRHFISQRGCKKCHFKTHRSWKKSPHAMAYDLLAPGEAVEAKRKAGLDPERDHRTGWTCLPCHTTGYGTPSGFPVPRAGERLTDELRWRLKNFAHVGCEACHGKGSEYAPYKKDHESYRRRDLVALGANIPVRAEHCTGCHKPGCPTMPEDYAFDFEASLRRESFHEEAPLKHDHGEAD